MKKLSQIKAPAIAGVIREKSFGCYETSLCDNKDFPLGTVFDWR